MLVEVSILNKRKIIVLLLILINQGVSGQIINPWTNSQIKLSGNCEIINNGIFEGFNARYGIYAHKGNSHKYKALPFLLLPAERINAPVLVILNGGPGVSNLFIPEGTDSLLKYFNIIIPGYRGVDDCFNDSYDEFYNLKKQSSCNINNISDDISNIISALKIDSVYIAAHSFGSVYANKYILTQDNVNKKSIFISPVMTQNITTVICKMEQMVEKYFLEYHNGSEKYIKALNEIENAPNPKQLSMGLVLYLSEIQNGAIIDSLLEAGKPLLGLLQNTYDSYQLIIDSIDKKNKLSNYFNLNDTTYLNDLGSLGKYLHKYFIDEAGSYISKFCPIQLCAPDTIFSAYYDYSVCSNSTAIENTGHSDIWSIAWRYIVDFYKMQRRK